MNFGKFRACRRSSTQIATVDPALHFDVRFRFELQVPLAGILAIFVLESLVSCLDQVRSRRRTFIFMLKVRAPAKVS